MAKCGYCGTTIIFGGMKENGLRFCNSECHRKGRVLVLSRDIPQNLVDEQAGRIHRGSCPKCQGNGPVDVHSSYRVYSMLIYTSWRTAENVCCRSCGTRRQIWDAMFSLILGWWGFPWGLIMTPVQISRNIVGMLRGPDDIKPSAKLDNIVRVNIASQVIQNQQTT